MVSFHGSPGGPEDFSQISKLLKHNFLHTDRQKNSIIEKEELDQQSIFIGYSWGCRELFRFLKSNPSSPQLVILISPYLFAEPIGLFKKLILSTPFIGNKILSKMSKKAIDSFLSKSSHPQDVPSEYQDYKKHLLKTKVLKQSLFEKDLFSLDDVNKRTPILLIWGESDQTSNYDQQIAPLIKHTESINIKKISSGGHALPWTHSQEVADLISHYLKKEGEVL